jgi:thiamine monophosphate synthase
LFIVNDRIDVGLAIGADGFQLGARSLPLAVARQLVGEDYLLGASIHSGEEALAAEAGGADFLLVGTIFASHTHPGEPPSGTELLRAIRRAPPGAFRDRDLEKDEESSQIPIPERHACPLLAIGGITQANARQVIEAGADGIAVMSAIIGSADIKQVIRELRAAINGVAPYSRSKESRETYERNR